MRLKTSSILINLSLVLIGIAFVLVTSESFLRLNPKFGYIYNSFKKTELGLDNFTNYLRPSSLLGYEPIPGRDRFNSYGLVGKEYNLQKNNNTFRILLLGDSIAWQDYSRQFLEDSLNNDASSNAKYKFEIWNASCPSYDIRRYALYLQHKGLAYKPDMVMIFFCMNDFNLNLNFYYKENEKATAYFIPLNEVSKRFIVNHFLIKYSYFYRFLMLKIDSYLIVKKKLKNDLQEEDGKYYMQMIQDICNKNNIQLFVVIFPYLKPLKEYQNYQIDQYQTMCKVIKNLHVDYINLYEYLPEKELHGLRNKKDDDIHPSKDGHILIGKIIYSYLLEKYFHNN